jgi:hypothetical protein
VSVSVSVYEYIYVSVCCYVCVFMNIYIYMQLLERKREESAIRQRRVVCGGLVSRGRGLVSRARGLVSRGRSLVLSHTVEFYSILSASSIRPRM